jgi:hypothetical protein
MTKEEHAKRRAQCRGKVVYLPSMKIRTLLLVVFFTTQVFAQEPARNDLQCHNIVSGAQLASDEMVIGDKVCRKAEPASSAQGASAAPEPRRASAPMPVQATATASIAAPSCRTTFSVVYKDELNNIRQGLPETEEKEVRKATAKRYPELCYVAPGPSASVVFFVATASEKYQSTETQTSSQTVPTQGTVTDAEGNTSTLEGTSRVTTTETVPVERTRQILTLFIERPQPGGSYKLAHTVQEVGCHAGGKQAAAAVATAGWSALFAKCHSRRIVIEDAMNWIHSGGLTDPLQTVGP